jgi:hypothetical protein
MPKTALSRPVVINIFSSNKQSARPESLHRKSQLGMQSKGPLRGTCMIHAGAYCGEDRHLQIHSRPSFESGPSFLHSKAEPMSLYLFQQKSPQLIRSEVGVSIPFSTSSSLLRQHVSAVGTGSRCLTVKFLPMCALTCKSTAGKRGARA